MRGFAFIVFGVLCALCVVSAQPPIPNTYPGIQLANPTANILIEVYGDYQCPDTLTAWNNVIKPLLAIPKYKNSISFIYHYWPLPYHHNSFDAAVAAEVVTRLSNVSNVWYTFSDILFNEQTQFYNAPTFKLSQQDVWTNVFAPMAQKVGVSQAAFLQAMSTNDDALMAVWGSFKFSSLRSVYGTPQWSLNGVNSDAAYNWTLQDLEKWIDSALKKGGEHKQVLKKLR
eukprot:PhF_6_TR43615/c0_g1_i1/m.67003